MAELVATGTGDIADELISAENELIEAGIEIERTKVLRFLRGLAPHVTPARVAELIEACAHIPTSVGSPEATEKGRDSDG